MNNSIKERVRVFYNVRKNLELAKKIFTLHEAAGNRSVLLTLDGFNWDSTGPKINFCLDKHDEAVKLGKRVEELYRQRDAVLAEITDIIRASKLLLLHTYPDDPDKLSEWGFLTSNHPGAIEKVPP